MPSATCGVFDVEPKVTHEQIEQKSTNQKKKNVSKMDFLKICPSIMLKAGSTRNPFWVKRTSAAYARRLNCCSFGKKWIRNHWNIIRDCEFFNNCSYIGVTSAAILL